MPPEPTNPPITIQIMLAQSQEFHACQMARAQAVLKNYLNISSSANTTETHPPKNQCMSIPSLMEISSDAFMAGEMAILQAKLKKIVCPRYG